MAPIDMTVLTTNRLRLEPMREAHLVGLNEMNADPEVMRYLSGQPETLDGTRAMIERVQRRWLDIGYSWWTFIETETGQVIGAGAVQNLRREATLVPDLECPLEIGWRLRRDRWGMGFAQEAARAIGSYAFDVLRAEEIFAVCNPANTASMKVMQRLGMQYRGVERWYGKALPTYWTDANRGFPHTSIT